MVNAIETGLHWFQHLYSTRRIWRYQKGNQNP